MLIECNSCAVRGPGCGDCVVSVLLGSPPAGDVPGAGQGTVIELDGAEQAAIAVLAGSGLVPPLRLLPITAVERGDRAAARTPPEPGATPAARSRGPARSDHSGTRSNHREAG